jgi:hypothetical protein
MAALMEAAKPAALPLDSFGAGVERCSATKREIDSGLRENVSPRRFHSGPRHFILSSMQQLRWGQVPFVLISRKLGIG